MTVAEAFGRATEYDRHALVQRRVVAALAERIAALPLPPRPRVLEVGCGTGLLGAALIDRLPAAHWLLTDLSPAMVERTRRRFAGRPQVHVEVMNGEHPTVAGPFDLVCSSLAAQWFGDLPTAIARLRALLAPGGTLIFTTLAAGSFEEWRQAHGDRASGVRDYPDKRELAALGLDVRIDAYPARHGDAREFLRSLKAIGAGTPRPGHRPLSPAELRKVMERFDRAGATATYVVATCSGGAQP